MANIKCKACGKRYDYYEHGCCPECGAYNRPPQRDRVDVDGTVHHLNDSEFFDDSAARRRQSGKVCFEREECHEDQVRHSASPFDSVPMQKKKKDGSSAGGVKKLVKTVAIAVILANLLPLLLTMCSFSDVMDGVEDFFTNVSVEPVRPEPLPDGETEHTTQMGNTFLWWDHNAIVADAALADLGDGAYQLNMTMIREEAYDEPVVFYTAMDGYQEKSGCDGVTQLDDVTYIYPYPLENYARGAFCQKDKLHYLVVTLNTEGENRHVDTLENFGRTIETFGVQKAYALDGGQTATIAMNNRLINSVVYGSQRGISDIFYFATALPSGD